MTHAIVRKRRQHQVRALGRRLEFVGRSVADGDTFDVECAINIKDGVIPSLGQQLTPRRTWRYPS